MRGFNMGLGAIALQVAAVSGLKYGEQYSNTTVIGSQGLVTSSVEMTTQTIYATKVRTITSCKPEVTNCPAGGHHVTTETIAISTTVCPVSEADKTKPTTTPTPTQWTTSTVYTTNVRTITSCPPQVPNCPAGHHVTTETIAVSTTVCPVTDDDDEPTSTPAPTQWNDLDRLHDQRSHHHLVPSPGPQLPRRTHVTTETIALSTTVCPVTESHPPKTLVTQNPPQSQPPKPQPSAKTTAVGTGSFPPTRTGTAPIGLPTAAAGRVGSGMAGVAAGVLIAALL
ncbi:predicted protein [Verticillium alfalfae VaMs.102]|uniref:Predicted protein n=1 Tax=Verticillium alfalfae (strain VaMs.102 / ATCC MYA-4576 / FGSC 10136) TaxID=526221 RepID=C9SAF6_VERA1|nr:predicted protein [Verticillium alfalfae VaMs.102]EEY16324.1 predicted protein [Verticillium alfalfae VaMs.102]